MNQPRPLVPGRLTLAELREFWTHPGAVVLDASAYQAIDAAARAVADLLASGRIVYGVNTGFGLLANTAIPRARLEELQRKLVLSHACGVGPLLDDAVIRLMIALKIASLARGHSGVRRDVVDALSAMLEHDLLPEVPAQGSVGASGDLAPLAHVSAALIGEGSVRYRGERLPATEAWSRVGRTPVLLGPKEGLALLNGTQASTALALVALFSAENAFAAATAAGMVSVDALKGSHDPFDPRIHEARGHPGAIDFARVARDILGDSEIHASHRDCDKVQDPYSLRCQPQVMGACLDLLRKASELLAIEANAVTDNPLIFPDDGDSRSGGNFHAEPVAFAADMIAMAVTEIASLSERRLALLVDPKMSGLPAFLVRDSGVNSGFMIAQVTAAALVSENKMMAHPASVDSIPTSANQEDHVSMATLGARRSSIAADNACQVAGIELLAACQAIDLLRPLRSSEPREAIWAKIRAAVPAYQEDRFFGPDLLAVRELVMSGTLRPWCAGILPSEANP